MEGPDAPAVGSENTISHGKIEEHDNEVEIENDDRTAGVAPTPTPAHAIEASSSADARVAAAPGAPAVCLIKGAPMRFQSAGTTAVESGQQKNGGSIQAESSRAKLSNILKRPRSRSVGGDAAAAATATGSGEDGESARRTKGSKRFEARWGRPQQQTSSPSPLPPFE